MNISSADQASSLDGNLKRARAQKDEDDASPPVTPPEEQNPPDPKWNMDTEAVQNINKAVLSDTIPPSAEEEKLLEKGVKTAPKPKKRGT